MVYPDQPPPLQDTFWFQSGALGAFLPTGRLVVTVNGVDVTCMDVAMPKPDLASMARRSLLVNTSRSGLIEEGALESEIAKGRIHAAVDVFDSEPVLGPEHILFRHPNDLPTPISVLSLRMGSIINSVRF